MAALLLLVAFSVGEALADTSPTPMGTCTNNANYNINYSSSGSGIFSQIQTTIKNYVLNSTSTIFNGIVQAPNIIHAMQAACTLYIAMYGMLFMFGLIQATVFDLIVRLVKVGAVAMFFASPWAVFNATFYQFFYNGMNELIGTMVATAMGGLYDPTLGPFSYMDDAIAMVISPKMAATLIAAFTTGPYGMGIGLVILMSLTTFVKSLLQAMWVYIAATIMMLFMFALAPLFLPCILFERSRSLFDGWINQCLNCMLQPVFLFAFFSFFVILFESCLNQIFNVPVCWTPIAGALKGAPFEEAFWRFADWDCTNNVWAPFDGLWDFNGPQDHQDHTQPGCPALVHPLGIALPLALWIISDIAGRFNDIVVQVAMDIANASTDLRLGIQNLAGQAMSAGSGTDKKESNQAGGASTGNRTPSGGQPNAAGAAGGNAGGAPGANPAAALVGGRAGPNMGGGGNPAGGGNAGGGFNPPRGGGGR